MRKLLYAVCLLCSLGGHAQQVISLAGAWDFATGDETGTKKGKTFDVTPRQRYNDFVMTRATR